MRVARLHGVYDLRLHDEPEPTPGAEEVLLQISAVGLCGSDLLWWSEGAIGETGLLHPLVLGHEFSAVVASGPRIGQRVAVDPAISCGTCVFCREGRPNLCAALRFAGHGKEDGALREYIAWPERCLHPLPRTVSDEAGALLEPLGVALHAVDLGEVRPGMTVGVFGCGPIGLLILQVARLAGAEWLAATDRLPHRLNMAREFGAAALFLAQGGRAGAEIAAAKGGRGVDVAFEVAGDNHAVEAALVAVRPGGRVVLVGIPADDRTDLTASVARRKELTLQLVRRMRHTYPRAIQLVESGQVRVDPLVTHRFPLERTAEALAVAQRREGCKVVVMLK